ncbi:Putative beta-barrel porin-2, OmpL-like. bbp2 [Hymenobacter gelipurpurascens]|uniref:Putative beta-barrel porin-2, OmpL-like. bbp2 n=1 Tax=Hymenobacter gelipurpurascens TaxID=89968 RepID=A0A212TQ96_9BACT|nr:porin [Hymenobacter gelipurpurascens]SNC68026.1 Putative beta-barrel porin-2, OmpL-like. bbp2 [Hymenobacter gelipurpurascens]
MAQRYWLIAKVLVLVAFGQLRAPAVMAQAASPDSAVAAKPLTFYGFVDGYYGYDFKHVDTNNRPSFLYSHNRQNEFAVNNAILGLRYNDGNVRGALGLHAGTYVAANYANEDPALRHLYEAYAGFRPLRKAWLDVGIFTSHIGFESAISKDNWTLTRSLSAENSPYYETGARLIYEVAPQLTLTALVLNGWQNIRENNQGKALGTQIQWKPTDKLLINSSTFYGNDQLQDVPKRRRYFHDFYVTYAVTDHWSVAGVFDVGKQEQATRGSRPDTWHTGAAFVRYQPTPQWAIAGRAEYYYAKHGVIINAVTPAMIDADFNTKAASLTIDYLPTSHVTARLEGRTFYSRSAFLLDRNNQPTNNYGNLTSSIAISF